MIACEASTWPIVRLVAAPKALLALMNVLHVGMFAQICVRSIATPPIGPGAPILLPPKAGSLK